MNQSRILGFAISTALLLGAVQHASAADGTINFTGIILDSACMVDTAVGGTPPVATNSNVLTYVAKYKSTQADVAAGTANATSSVS